MKRMWMFFVGALLVCGLAFAQTEQNPPAPATGQNLATDTTVLNEGTGTIEKIDPKARAITISNYSMTPAAGTEPGTENQEPATGETKVFNYSERTNFASSNPEAVDGRMSDLKVGDVVRIQTDDQNMILRIEEVSASPAPQQ